MSIGEFIESKKTIFWDFDGVIKDSVDAKKNAYVSIFGQISSEHKEKIVNHHTKNGGVSRYVKIPLYLEIVGLATNQSNVDIFLDRFAALVKNRVICSPWVPGVYDFIENYCKHKSNILTTATPYDEIVEILDELSINLFFEEIHGAPVSKTSAIKQRIISKSLLDEDCIMIGDSSSDLQAAVDCGIDFALRKTGYNADLIDKSTYSFEDFL